MSDLEKIKKSGNKARINKLQQILLELVDHPLTGTGKPERLRHMKDTYSRRLTDNDRVVYTIIENVVEVDILQMMGHYDDK